MVICNYLPQFFSTAADLNHNFTQSIKHFFIACIKATGLAYLKSMIVLMSVAISKPVTIINFVQYNEC